MKLNWQIKSKIELPNGNYRVVICGLNRVIIKNYKNNPKDREILESVVKRIYIDNSDEASETAVIRTLKSVVGKYMEINPSASNKCIFVVKNDFSSFKFFTISSNIGDVFDTVTKNDFRRI